MFLSPTLARIDAAFQQAGSANSAQWRSGLMLEPTVDLENPHEMRFVVNHHLRLMVMQLQLSKPELEQQTTRVRFCLIDNGTEEEWARAIQLEVAPFLISQGVA